ncbi:hypothetical protein ABIA35_004465 [Catenulispora sp. MAP12-49]|uniref:hypothetical protein n=1 Tax=unclassified Catenulispora TaxID=414885 RepID=UPI0035196C62
MDNADALATSGLMAAFITQGFGFLYGQLDEILQRHRDGRLSEPIAVPADQAPGILDALTTPLIVRPDVVQHRLSELQELNERLAHHRGHELDPGDPRLRAEVAELISVLEAVFGQRFTAGLDDRLTGGLHVVQEADDVYGSVTALWAGHVGREADGTVEQKIGTVHSGGEAVAARLDSLG